MVEKITKTEEEWRAQLTEEEFYVTRQHGTERAFTGEYDQCKDPGTYVCRCCGHPLFDSDHKMLWYKMSVGSGGLLAQCFECMRVCPIATQAPLADPIRRFEAALDEDG